MHKAVGFVLLIVAAVAAFSGAKDEKSAACAGRGPARHRRPDPRGRGDEAHDAAGGVLGHALRGRAGRRSADRLHLRRPRAAVGGRVPHVPQLEHRRQARQQGKGPHHRLRRHRRRRQVRQAHRLRRRPCERLRPRTRVRRRLRLLDAPPAVHPRRLQRRRAQADRPAAGRCSTGGTSSRPVTTSFNGLTWGPDGWLYGLNGIQSKSAVGKPGTPDEQRVKFDCGVWRYHPTKHTFEVVCWGTTNPFGLDFDEYGQAFFTNCVIKHLWHAIPGAHFQRMYGQDPVAERLPADGELRRPRPLVVGNWTDVRGRPEQEPGRRRRARPRRGHDLPRRQLARHLPQRPVHLQPARQPRQRRRSRAKGLRLRRPPRPRLHAGQRPVVPRHRRPLRPRRRRLRQRLDRHRRVPQPPSCRPHQRPGLQDRLRQAEAVHQRREQAGRRPACCLAPE